MPLVEQIRLALKPSRKRRYERGRQKLTADQAVRATRPRRDSKTMMSQIRGGSAGRVSTTIPAGKSGCMLEPVIVMRAQRIANVTFPLVVCFASDCESRSGLCDCGGRADVPPFPPLQPASMMAVSNAKRADTRRALRILCADSPPFETVFHDQSGEAPGSNQGRLTYDNND